MPEKTCLLIFFHKVCEMMLKKSLIFSTFSTLITIHYYDSQGEKINRVKFNAGALYHEQLNDSFRLCFIKNK